jgi:hypothetical protein
MKYKIFAVIILAFALVLANIKFSNFKFKHIVINKEFPYKIGDWVGEDVEPYESTYEILKKEELLFRKYKNIHTGEILMLSIVSGERRENVHGPTVCYQGQGIKFLNDKVVNIDKNTKVNFILGSKNKHKLYIYYWYTDFDKIFLDSFKFSVDLRKRMILNQPIEGMGLVIVNAYRPNDKETKNFAADVNNILLNLEN